MKTYALLNLYNDRTFLMGALESLNNLVDVIVIADGAYQTYLQFYREFVPDAQPFSTDGSLELAKLYKRKTKPPKICIHQFSSCWPNQTEKRNFLINQVPDGDCFLIIDADEMVMGDPQEELEKFYDSGCIAMRTPLYNTGLNQDKVIPKWHPRIFIKKPGMHYKGTHWHLRDSRDRIIEEHYPMHYSDLMAFAHFKGFKDQSRLVPQQQYMLQIAERGWAEPKAPKTDQGENLLGKETNN